MWSSCPLSRFCIQSGSCTQGDDRESGDTLLWQKDHASTGALAGHRCPSTAKRWSIARDFGVSHETVQAIVQKVKQAAPTA